MTFIPKTHLCKYIGLFFSFFFSPKKEWRISWFISLPPLLFAVSQSHGSSGSEPRQEEVMAGGTNHTWDCISFQQMVGMHCSNRAVLLHPCTNGMIRAFFGHWREEDVDSFQLRRKRGLNSHLLILCSIQKDASRRKITDIAGDSLCLRIE